MKRGGLLPIGTIVNITLHCQRGPLIPTALHECANNKDVNTPVKSVWVLRSEAKLQPMCNKSDILKG